MSDLNGQKVGLPNGATAWQPCMIASDSIGPGTNIGALSHIGRNVTIGSRCKIQGSVYIADECVIGDEVFIGPNEPIEGPTFPKLEAETPNADTKSKPKIAKTIVPKMKDKI